MAARVTQRPNRLTSFFTAARQHVSEVESYFSSDEDGNLDWLELLEGRHEEACETLCRHSAIGALELSKPKQP